MTPFVIPTIPEAYRKLRYKVKYFIVDTKLKWYSTSRNPRLVQSKFQGQTLITLRVHPRDKYLVKPGEFLSVERKRVNSFSLNSFVDMYCQEIVDNMSFPEYKEGETSAFDKSLAESAVSQIQTVDIPETPMSPLTRASNFFRSTPKGETNEETKQDDKPLESPGIRAWKRKHLLRLMRRLGWQEEEVVDVEKELVESKRVAESESASNKVWERVLNDISLSAAQISTGSAPSSREDFENLNSDLTAGRRRPTTAQTMG